MPTSERTAMTALQWQLAHDAAEHYEQVLVPAYLGPAAEAVVRAADPQPGETVLDVGCGTGAAAREALRRVTPGGRVIGMDVNTWMLGVAREHSAGVELREGDARTIPMRDHAVDVAVCANTLQFVPERAKVASQLARVVRAGGRVAVGTWSVIEENPYFDALARAIEATMGRTVATHLTSACTLGTAPELRGALEAGGLRDVAVTEVEVAGRLGDLATFIPRHLAATPMAAAFRGAGDEAVADVVRAVLHDLATRDPGAGDAAYGAVPFLLLVGTATA